MIRTSKYLILLISCSIIFFLISLVYSGLSTEGQLRPDLKWRNRGPERSYKSPPLLSILLIGLYKYLNREGEREREERREREWGEAGQ